MSKKLLLVVDCQKDFIDGALGFEGAKDTIKLIEKEIQTYKSNNDLVWFTLDEHTEEEYKKSIEGKMLPIPHCIKGTDGARLDPSIAKQIGKGNVCVVKDNYGSLVLAKLLEKMSNIAEIKICGLITDICVFANAVLLRSTFNNIPIVIDKKLVNSPFTEKANNALLALSNINIDIRD